MARPKRPGRTVSYRIRHVSPLEERVKRDAVATEEPLEIRVAFGTDREAALPVAVTMRTPGDDFHLAAGFLVTENLIQTPAEVESLSYCTDFHETAQMYNVVTVELAGGPTPGFERLQRRFYTTSSCGVCGKASLDAVRVSGCRPAGPGPVVSRRVLRSLPDQLRESQVLFERTGGIHAAGLFDADGRLLGIKEDIGRHNAVDKLVGEAFLAGKLPLDRHVLMVSGRASFEIMQKAAVAGIPIVVAVSAPSSLAVEFAREFNMTLVGFLRGDRFNVYAGAERLETFTQTETDATAAHVAPPIFCVVGPSGSGKTSLATALIAELRQRGARVGSVKHAHHGVDLADEGKDSGRHLGSGAVAAAAVGPGLVSVAVRTAGEKSLGEISRALTKLAGEPLDVVVAEGYTGEKYPKLAVIHPHGPSGKPAAEAENVIAWIRPYAGEFEAPDWMHPCFGHQDVGPLVDFLVERFDLG